MVPDQHTADFKAFLYLSNRKLKNRVAAQTARDRKKEHMTDLECVVADLQAHNQKLQLQNNALRKQTDLLTMENDGLRERLGESGETPAVVAVKTEPVSPESAVLGFGSQQQDRTRSTFTTTPTACLAVLLTLRYVSKYGI